MNTLIRDPGHPRWSKGIGSRGHGLIARVRGKADHCLWGHTHDLDDRPAKFEWANLTGDFMNPDDYAPMCRVCHRRFDMAQRMMLRGLPNRYLSSVIPELMSSVL